MARLVIVVVVLGLGVALALNRAEGGDLPAAPRASTAGVPPQFQEILARRPDPISILRERGALPGLGAIRRLAGGGSNDVPPQPRPFADVGSRAELREVRRDIRRDIAALNRLSEGDGASAAEVERTLADVYSAPVLAALGATGRRDFAARVAGRSQVAQQVKVLDYRGVFVSGNRALAQVVYRLSTRAPSGRFVARSPEIWTVTLSREDGRWRFVRGFES
jgi:hypothetical protein